MQSTFWNMQLKPRTSKRRRKENSAKITHPSQVCCRGKSKAEHDKSSPPASPFLKRKKNPLLFVHYHVAKWCRQEDFPVGWRSGDGTHKQSLIRPLWKWPLRGWSSVTLMKTSAAPLQSYTLIVSLIIYLFSCRLSRRAGGRAGMVTVQGEGEGNAEQRLLTATRPSVPARQLWSIRSKWAATFSVKCAVSRLTSDLFYHQLSTWLCLKLTLDLKGLRVWEREICPPLPRLHTGTEAANGTRPRQQWKKKKEWLWNFWRGKVVVCSLHHLTRRLSWCMSEGLNCIRKHFTTADAFVSSKLIL